MSEVILFYLNKQELNWIRYSLTFGRSFSSHSTLSIAFKVSWPPTNLPIKSMLKGLTSSFSFVFFFGKLSNSVHKQNKTTVADQGERAGGPAFPLLLDHQTEARRAEKKIFLRPPPPPPPPYLKVWIRHWTIYNTRPEKFLHVQMSTTMCIKNVTCQTRNAFHPNDDKSET